METCYLQIRRPANQKELDELREIWVKARTWDGITPLPYLKYGKSVYGAFTPIEPVGGILYQPENQNVLRIDSLAAKEDFRGRGIGRRLLEETLKYAKKRGYRIIKVSSDPKNTDFYTNLGLGFIPTRLDSNTFDILITRLHDTPLF